MANSTTPEIAFPIDSVKVVTDRFCTQLTHRVKKHVPDEASERNCKYEVYDHCIGTKVVDIVAGENIYKFHDGCLGKVSRELGQMAKTSNSVVIEEKFAPSTARALNYILKPFMIKSLSREKKYDLVLFGARYGLPPNHISKLIDRSIYADLVEYAWMNNNTYLMVMLQKVRIPDVQIAEDLIKTQDKTRLKFVRKYLEHEYHLKKYARIRVFMYFVIVSVWFLLLFCAIRFDGTWFSPPHNSGYQPPRYYNSYNHLYMTPGGK
uniref:Uncharacterized protein n=1 Tax=Panagrellus redivivus TaxID=6233 RepID=A0A7E4VVL0_PANRE